MTSLILSGIKNVRFTIKMEIIVMRFWHSELCHYRLVVDDDVECFVCYYNCKLFPQLFFAPPVKLDVVQSSLMYCFVFARHFFFFCRPTSKSHCRLANFIKLIHLFYKWIAHLSLTSCSIYIHSTNVISQKRIFLIAASCRTAYILFVLLCAISENTLSVNCSVHLCAVCGGLCFTPQ